MQEDFLHYLWKHKKFNLLDLKTTAGEHISIVSVGQHNQNSGPDFFAAQLKIDNQHWAGNVEIHVKASDWFVHNHENDKAYDNVILHVVWEQDTDIFRKDNTTIPTLVLQEVVSKEALQNYQELFSKSQKWINCENNFASIDDFVVQNWLERLYFERLERKSHDIEKLLKTSSNNWEEVLFKMLAKNFGLKVNAEAFLSISNSFDFSVVRKQQSKVMSLEALFFGQAGLLEGDNQDVYYLELAQEYKFLKQKFNLSNENVTPLQFFRLRPSNFPTIRLPQLAMLYHEQQNLFSKIMNTKSVEELYKLFTVATSTFWETHYTFNKTVKQSKKVITKSFIDLLLINTIIPLKFSYLKYQGKVIDDEIVEIIQNIVSEKNSIIEKFNSIKSVSITALQSQALLQLKNEYCDKNKCLRCAIGNNLLGATMKKSIPGNNSITQ
ncbi:MAG: DUF2851 family protein [Flavobacteriaceae bacterium]|nr:DUF2851 family protein [Flavobacteriaceae bacterium]